MTNTEEEKMIKVEVEWTERFAEEKLDELHKAQERYNKAKFRADTTKKALDDFYTAHPEMRVKK